MTLKNIFKGLFKRNQPSAKSVFTLDYKDMPAELRHRIGMDALNACAGILLEYLPDPEKLEKLADWFDICYTGTNTSDKVQADLRKWVEGVRKIQNLFEGSKREEKDVA